MPTMRIRLYVTDKQLKQYMFQTLEWNQNHIITSQRCQRHSSLSTETTFLHSTERGLVADGSSW